MEHPAPTDRSFQPTYPRSVSTTFGRGYLRHLSDEANLRPDDGVEMAVKWPWSLPVNTLFRNTKELKIKRMAFDRPDHKRT